LFDRSRFRPRSKQKLTSQSSLAALLLPLSSCRALKSQQSERAYAQQGLIKGQLHKANTNITKLHTKLKMINTELPSALTSRGSSGSGGAQPTMFPVIALGIKEATPVDLHRSFGAFVVQHYHEPISMYAAETQNINMARNKMREAPVTVEGRALVLDYFGKLLQAEHRFFQEDKCHGLAFNWFDSLDGRPATSKSIRLEKAAVMYNAAAMSSQLAAMEDGTTEAGLEAAAVHFQHAAGILQYIHEENFFKSVVSTDLCRTTVSSLSLLMLAQAQECIWHARMLSFKSGAMADQRPEGSEAAAVAEWYASCRESLSDPLASRIPKEWAVQIEAKELLFTGIADWHSGSVEMVHSSKSKSIGGLAKVLRAQTTLEAAKAVARKKKTDRRLIKMANEYLDVVQLVLERVNQSIIDELRPKVGRIAAIKGKAVRWSTGLCELINQSSQMDDVFARMGPVYFFNSMCALVERRTHTIEHSPAKNYGLTASGGNPVRISDVAYNSRASLNGVLAGDYIITVNGIDVRGMVTTEVTDIFSRLHLEGHDLELTVVVNYDMQNFEELINPEVPKCVRSASQLLPMPVAWNMKFDLRGKVGTVRGAHGVEC
jgi:hypothetical protein